MQSSYFEMWKKMLNMHEMEAHIQNLKRVLDIIFAFLYNNRYV